MEMIRRDYHSAREMDQYITSFARVRAVLGCAVGREVGVEFPKIIPMRLGDTNGDDNPPTLRPVDDEMFDLGEIVKIDQDRSD